MSCPVCGGDALQTLVSIPALPVFCNVLFETREAALAAPRGNVRLIRCRSCSHLFNGEFEASLVEYSPRYENSLHHSSVFQGYASALCGTLEARFGITRKTRVLEIGCGSGEFLEMLVQRTGAQALGIDQSLPEERVGAHGSMRLARISLAEAGREGPFDLVVFRHVLEHIEDPIGFLRAVRDLVSHEGTAIYCEVPNGALMLDDLAIWDLIYEHVGYFTARSLRQVFDRSSLERGVVECAFGDQYLQFFWSPELSSASIAEPSGRETGQSEHPGKDSFASTVEEKLEFWKRELATDSRTTAVWGAGSKGVTFANLCLPSSDGKFLVDQNPRKHGRFVPGTGHVVKPPDAEVLAMVDRVIVMNPLYREEIEAVVHATRPEAEVVAV